MKKIIDIIKKMPITIVLALILIIVLVIMGGFVIPTYNNIDFIGETNGKIIGTALGSMDGVTKGYKEGYDRGKEEGLSAEDTVVEIVNDQQLLGSGNLQVLTLSAKTGNFHSIADDYAALYIKRCQVTYSVDLNNVKVQSNGNTVTIIFPEPTVTISDKGEEEKIFEAQKFSFTGSSKDGAEAFLNSLNQVQNSTEEEFANSKELKKQAIESARKQIKSIAESAILGNPTIVVKCETDEVTQ